jgi:hypothetical protein
MISDDLVIKWFNRKKKLDHHCKLYDRKAEKAFKEEIAAFVNWLE